MTKCVVAAGLMGMLAFICGCGGPAAPAVTPTVDVAGTVQLDGQPMNEPEGEISFVMGGEAPVTLPIKEGKFEGKAPVGDPRVEIRAWRKGEPIMMDGKPFGDPVKENYIAPQFNDQSTLTAKIGASGAKDLKFEVQAKK